MRWKPINRHVLRSTSNRFELRQAWQLLDGEIEYGPAWGVWEFRGAQWVGLGASDSVEGAKRIVEYHLFNGPLPERHA